MLEMSASGVANSTSPKKKPLCQTCFLVLRCFGHCCGSPRAIGSDTSLTVSHKLNAEIPSICRPSSNEIISSSVLLCETAVCFFHDHEIGTHVWLPNMHNTPPDVDFESVRSPAKCAS